MIGFVNDQADGDKKYKFICPTMITRCSKLSDCKQTGDRDDEFCCEASIKFPPNHEDKPRICIPRYKEIYPDNLQPKDDANDLA